MSEPIVFTPTDFVAVFNQTMEYAYPSVTVQGELADYRVSKGSWLYFKLKDDTSSLHCFGTVAQLSQPLEEGMMLEVRAAPRLHAKYNFSLQVQYIRPVGEGSIKKAADMLYIKLKQEGLFLPERKRSVMVPPEHIGLITADGSAAQADFMKITQLRWGGSQVSLRDVHVQGERAPSEVIQAIDSFHDTAHRPDVVVIVRGGGSLEDLAAFNDEALVRRVAASDIPIVAAIGHETDVSLVELAADIHAATPSQAAELLSPDRREILASLRQHRGLLAQRLAGRLLAERVAVRTLLDRAAASVESSLREARTRHYSARQTLSALDPHRPLRLGYARVEHAGKIVRSVRQLKKGDALRIVLQDGQAEVAVVKTKRNNDNNQKEESS